MADTGQSENPNCSITRIDGKPDVRGADGLVHGDLLILSEEERAAIPTLAACDPSEPWVESNA